MLHYGSETSILHSFYPIHIAVYPMNPGKGGNPPARALLEHPQIVSTEARLTPEAPASFPEQAQADTRAQSEPCLNTQHVSGFKP